MLSICNNLQISTLASVWKRCVVSSFAYQLAEGLQLWRCLTIGRLIRWLAKIGCKGFLKGTKSFQFANHKLQALAVQQASTSLTSITSSIFYHLWSRSLIFSHHQLGTWMRLEFMDAYFWLFLSLFCMIWHSRQPAPAATTTDPYTGLIVAKNGGHTFYLCENHYMWILFKLAEYTLRWIGKVLEKKFSKNLYSLTFIIINIIINNYKLNLY